MDHPIAVCGMLGTQDMYLWKNGHKIHNIGWINWPASREKGPSDITHVYSRARSAPIRCLNNLCVIKLFTQQEIQVTLM